MATLNLDRVQLELLRKLIDGYLRELSHEIADTDRKDFRDYLKHEREQLLAISEQLAAQLPLQQ